MAFTILPLIYSEKENVREYIKVFDSPVTGDPICIYRNTKFYKIIPNYLWKLNLLAIWLPKDLAKIS